MRIVEKTIGGIVYRAQYKGLAFSSQLQDRCETEDGKRLLQYDIARALFDEVLVSPKVTIDDFDSYSDFDEVYNFLFDVARGELGEKKRSRARLKREVLDDWACWRLIYCDMANFTYDEVFNRMTPLEIEKANIALDIVQAEIKKQTKKKK